MKYFCIVAFIFLAFLATEQYALVHRVVLKPTAKGGCKAKGDLAIGQFEDDDKVCGVVVCQDNKGTALIHYCQSIPSFQYCTTDHNAISTNTPFPDCCWQCVKFTECAKASK